MLLLTTLTVGSSDKASIFAYLPAATRARLQEKLQALLAIPVDKRMPFMAREIKEAMNQNGMHGIERVDPSWIVHHLWGESPRVVATIMVTLPPVLAAKVYKRLPHAIQEQLPNKEDMLHVPESMSRAVRQVFEKRFAPMPAASSGPFAFRDILHLERLEIYVLMRDLGIIELGQAFATVGKMALAELCRRLPAERATELVEAVHNASTMDPPDIKSAQLFLGRVVENFEDAEEFFQKSGLWRIARASVYEQREFQLAFKQRIPVPAGNLFESYIAKAVEMQTMDQNAVGRLQDAILIRVASLAKSGALGERWRQNEFAFHDPAGARAAMNAADIRQTRPLSEAELGELTHENSTD